MHKSPGLKSNSLSDIKLFSVKNKTFYRIVVVTSQEFSR